MRVLVIGGYGLIGAAILRRFHGAGHEVTGFGRSAAKGRLTAPDAEWAAGDLAEMTRAGDWVKLTAGVDIVVNAAGALQNGLRDDVGRAQRDAMIALTDACAASGVRRFIQISAPGATAGATTDFYRTKAAADAHLAASGVPHTILRPGLVIGADSYGGSRLLRMLAAFPFIQPMALAGAKVKTVALDDVAAAALMAAERDIDGDFDLVEAEPRPLAEIILAYRAWLGFPPPKAVLRFPGLLVDGVSRAADALGWLGWRGPLRSNAIATLRDGVDGDSRPWESASGLRLRSLHETLRATPSTYQDRIAARATLVFPLIVAVLSVFWIASGVIGLWRFDAAMGELRGAIPDSVAQAAVIGGGVADIAVGAAMLIRRWLPGALAASMALAAGYLAGAAILTPWLWADPLGPMVKVVPAIALALAALALARER